MSRQSRETRVRRCPNWGLLAIVLAAAAMASPAHAALVETPSSPVGEVGVFGITGATASYNNTTDVLTVTINTWYAGAPGVGGGGSPSYGTGYGSLFLGSAGFNSTSSYPYNYAVTTPYGNAGNPVSTNPSSPTTTGLYATGTYTLPSNLQNQVITTSNGGKIIGSNVNGANPGNYIWGNGIVQYTPYSGQGAAESATVYVTPDSGTKTSQYPLGGVEGSITYTILDTSGLFKNGIIDLYWAMTCANQAISGTIDPTVLTGGNQGSTPLPAALPLFLGGLGMIGFFGARRRRITSCCTMPATQELRVQS